MATPSLAIAKAALTAALIRPDPVSSSRDQINELHELLDVLLAHCSTTNIQRCKRWIFSNTFASAAKAKAFTKYLASLSGSFATAGKPEAPHPGKQISSRRKQLHILYLVNDIFHEIKYHGRNHATQAMFTESFRQHVIDMFGHAAGHEHIAFPKHQEKLQALLELWGKHQYFDASFSGDLRNAAAGLKAKATEAAEADSAQRPAEEVSKEPPYEMPSLHGDMNAPYYELPATNMIPHITPNSRIPIESRRMKAMQFARGPAEYSLVTAVKSFLKEADIIYGLEGDEDNEIYLRPDDLGQMLYVDKLTGDVVGGESYYGWSKKFCERMKLKNGKGNRASSRSASRSRSRSRSLSRSASLHKRRRSPSMSRSGSRSRSPPARFRALGNDDSRSPPDRRLSRSPHRLREPSKNMDELSGSSYRPPVPQSYVHGGRLPFPFPGGVPFGPDGRPVPPPRPPHWTGPWPPPPPPPGHIPPEAFSGLLPPPPGQNSARGNQQWPPSGSSR